MGFLSPLSLLFALSLLGLVVIYLRARTRADLDVSSLLLFETVEAPVSRFRLLHLDIFFWLEAIALAALSLAVAGLYLRLPPQPIKRHRRALVFDLAASMGAQERYGTRLDDAKEQAATLLDRAGAGDQWSVVGYGAKTVLGCPFTSDRSTVRRAIYALKPQDVAATPNALASALMRVRDSDSIDLFAPRMPHPPPFALAAGEKLRFHQVGRGGDNAAIVSLDPGIPGQTQGHCVVRNMSTHPMMVVLDIQSDGRHLLRSPLIVEPKVSAPIPFGPLPKAGIVKARIISPDALAADNTRYAYVAPERSLKVVVLSPDPEVRADLARVTRAVAPASQIMAAAPANFNPAQLNGEPDLLILHDTADPGIKARARLLIFPKSGTVVKVAATLPSSQMDERVEQGPLVRPLDLGRTRELKVPEWMEPLARGTGPQSNQVLTLAAEGASPKGRVGVIAFNIRNHRLLDPDMLDTLVLTVDVLQRLIAPSNVLVVPTGSYVTIPTTVPAKVRRPNGSTVTLTPGYGERVRLRPLLAGPYEVVAGKRRVLVLANYFNARESDLSVGKPVPASQPLSHGVAASTVMPQARIRPLSLWLLALALAALLAESALMARDAQRGGARFV